MTIKELKELIEPLPDDALVAFHGYDKGMGLHSYRMGDAWTYPKGASDADVKCFVINPGDTYDGRRPHPSANSVIE